MSLTSALRAVASRGTDHGIRLFRGDQEAERLGFDQLYVESGQLACGLLERGVTAGERVAIALPTSLDFARAFFGVLAAGAVPVPLPPPVRFAPLDVYVQRIGIAMRHSRVERVLSDRLLVGLLEPLLADAGRDFRIIDVADCAAASPVYVEGPADRPALVQYTSGTSGNPRGVVLTHANLLANVEAITKGLGITDADVSCSWLPLFHDMGLIGTFLSAVFSDMETFLLPSEDFLRDPGRWLRIISRHGVTSTSAPNSGYLHTLRRIPAEQVREFDLSGWRLALNGAEAVDAELLRRFSEHFAPAGFRPTAFLPVYGLAEGTLAVTIPPPGRPVRTIQVQRDLLGEGVVSVLAEGTAKSRELASVGTPVAGTEVRLVTEDGAVLTDRTTVAEDGAGPTDQTTVAEIQIRGDSVMAGYEANEQATRAVVHDGGWVSTGDLGFRHQGELFVVGRKKEMVIIFGRNYYASDIESIAAAVPGVVNHGVLAAGIPFEDGERLVVFLETKEFLPEAREELISRIRYAVSSALDITPHQVILARRGRLPRTSSGKLLRHGLEDLYLQYTHPEHPEEPTEPTVE